VYPYVRERIYTPPDALLDDYLHMAATLGIERVVFVQPSVYGSDNSVLVDALAACPLPCRGVAVVGESVTSRQLQQLAQAGVRGVRFNWVDVAERGQVPSPNAVKALARRLVPFGWHAEFLLHVDDYPALEALLHEFPLEVVIGHMGYLRPHCRIDDPGFQSLRRLLSRGRCWVKLSAPYRISSDVGYEKARSLAMALVGEAPERILWGSDWPHVMVTGRMPNDGELGDLIAAWVPEPSMREQILVENPSVLYGF
jgi:predicted TIM-barrel fold metal-dependent hydrolase